MPHYDVNVRIQREGKPAEDRVERVNDAEDAAQAIAMAQKQAAGEDNTVTSVEVHGLNQLARVD